MAGSVIRYRAKAADRVLEIPEDGWVGIQGARKWCEELAEEDSTVDLYCLLVDGTEMFYGSFPSSDEEDLERLMFTCFNRPHLLSRL